MAGAAIAGMDSLVSRYYATEDSTERAGLRQIMLRGIELDGDRREDQAERIINALSRALDRSKRRSHSHG